MKYLLKKQILLLLILISTIACKTDNKNVETTKVSSALIENTLLKHTVVSNGHPMAV
jgi:hypothetical protein